MAEEEDTGQLHLLGHILDYVTSSIPIMLKPFLHLQLHLQRRTDYNTAGIGTLVDT